MIVSMNTNWVDSTPMCANLAYQQDAYVTTYKWTNYYGDIFYNKLCDNDKVQSYILNIKRGY